MKKLCTFLFSALCLIIMNAEISKAIEFGDGSYVWTPMDSYTAATGECYYCYSSNLRRIYAKETIENNKLLGFSLPEDANILEAAYKNGNCKKITASKKITTSGYECVGLFSGTTFLDIQFCRVYPGKYRELKSQGWSNSQFDKFFRNNERSLIQEFRTGKGI